MLLGKNMADNALNLRAIHRRRAPYIRCFRTVNIVQDRAGEKLCLIAPLLIQEVDHGLLLGV